MIFQFTQMIAGFSVFSALILLFSYLFFLPDMRKTQTGKLSCTLLLLGLAALQLAHSYYFSTGFELLNSKAYTYILLCIPFTFYFFSRSVLLPDFKVLWTDALHFLPIAFGTLLSNELVPVFSFFTGTIYTFWMAHIVYGLRSQSRRFKFEIFFFGLFAAIALMALLLGLSIPYIDNAIFYILYTNSIGLAMLLVVAALIIFPELSSDIVNITEIAYANSKLAGIDVTNKANQLENMMTEDKIFQNENLDLASLAKTLNLTTHQLSELINTKFEMGFPRYMREKRIAEAKKLLLKEPDASILSISLMTGFRSQSSFYTAFHEIAKQSPGSYRKNHSSTA